MKSVSRTDKVLGRFFRRTYGSAAGVRRPFLLSERTGRPKLTLGDDQATAWLNTYPSNTTQTSLAQISAPEPAATPHQEPIMEEDNLALMQSAASAMPRRAFTLADMAFMSASGRKLQASQAAAETGSHIQRKRKKEMHSGQQETIASSD